MLPAADSSPAPALPSVSGSEKRSLRRTVTFVEADGPAPGTHDANSSSTPPPNVFLDLPAAAAGAIQAALLLADGSQDAELEVELVLHHEGDAPPAGNAAAAPSSSSSEAVARIVRTPSGRVLQRAVSRDAAAARAGPPLSPTGMEVWPRGDSSCQPSEAPGQVAQDEGLVLHVSSLLRLAGGHIQQAALATTAAAAAAAALLLAETAGTQAARACHDQNRGQQHVAPASGHLNIRPVEAAVTGLLTPLLAAGLGEPAAEAPRGTAVIDSVATEQAADSAFGVSRAFSPSRQGRYQCCVKAAEPQGAARPQAAAAAELGCLLLNTLLELLAQLSPSARQALGAASDTRALMQRMLADAATCGGCVTNRVTALAALLSDSDTARCPPTELPGAEQQQPATHHPWLAWSLGSCREHNTAATSLGSAHSWLAGTASASLAGLRSSSGQQPWHVQLPGSIGTGLAPASSGSRYCAAATAAPGSASQARSASAAMAAARDKLHERKLHTLLSQSGTRAADRLQSWSDRRAWPASPVASSSWQPRFTAAAAGVSLQGPGAPQHLLERSPWPQPSLEGAAPAYTTAAACTECGLSMSSCCGCSV